MVHSVTFENNPQCFQEKRLFELLVWKGILWIKLLKEDFGDSFDLNIDVYLIIASYTIDE